jgi:hypothetical protein
MVYRRMNVTTKKSAEKALSMYLSMKLVQRTTCGIHFRAHRSYCVLASRGLRTSGSGLFCADHTPVHKILISITDISITLTQDTALCSPCSTLASPALDHPSHETSVLPSLNPEGRSVEHYIRRSTPSA